MLDDNNTMTAREFIDLQVGDLVEFAPSVLSDPVEPKHIRSSTAGQGLRYTGRVVNIVDVATSTSLPTQVYGVLLDYNDKVYYGNGHTISVL